MPIVSCKPPAVNVCKICSEVFESGRPSKYCGRKCREVGRVLNSGVPCGGCEKLMFPSPSAITGKPTCRDCRSRKHGTSTAYKRGCRCDICSAAKTSESRAFNERKRAEFGVHYSVIQRRRFREANGYWPSPRGGDWIAPKLRLEIYERDNWNCYLCCLPVDRDGDPNGDHAPSLDHIYPKSLGGSDDPSNLKTACRSCNSRKGVKVLAS